MSTTSTALMTAEELMELPDDGFRYELVNGELEKMPPPGFPHGRIAMRLCVYCLDSSYWSMDWVKQSLLTPAFKLTSNPDTVLAPDFRLLQRSVFAKGKDIEGYWQGPPDLAVEVLSPTDRAGKVKAKISRWFSFGTKQVWIVDPKHSTVTVYRSQSDTTMFSESDYLEAQDLLPGFQISLERIFKV